MTRISRKVREEAALICAIGASNRDFEDWYGGVAGQLGIGMTAPSTLLAIAAWSEVWDRETDHWTTPTGERDAEAECLLRTGWSP